MASICEHCGSELQNIPFTCRRCESVLCPKCRLPENHSCEAPTPVQHVTPEELEVPARVSPRAARSAKYLFAGVFIFLLLGGLIYLDIGPPFWGESTVSSSLNTTEVEELVIENINAEREARGIPSLSSSDTLAGIAREHSQDMIERDFYDHINPEGLGPRERVASFSPFLCSEVGEVILAVPYNVPLELDDGEQMPALTTEEEVAEYLVNGWMDSPFHRDSILNWRAYEAGVGIEIAADGEVFSTVKLCQ